MALEALIAKIRAGEAAVVVDPTLDLDVDALADELEALSAIFTHEDDEAEDGDDGGLALDGDHSGAIHVLQIDSPAKTSARRDAHQQDDLSQTDLISQWKPQSRIRLMLNTSFTPASSEGNKVKSVPIRLAITIPGSYPTRSHGTSANSQAAPPQLQLLSRFVGPYAVDSSLFGAVLRTNIHYDPGADGDPAADLTIGQSSPSDERPLSTRGEFFNRSKDVGVRWTPGEPVLYEGIESVREVISDWYEAKREVDNQRAHDRAARSTVADGSNKSIDTQLSSTGQSAQPKVGGPASRPTATATTFTAPDDPPRSSTNNAILSRLFRTEALVERKSIFIAHAARLDHPDEVPIVLSHILSDRKIAKATHPIIHAWVCTSKAEGSAAVTVHRDHDDDGESAAGGRLAHLLDLLDLQNALIVVTRWYGGVLLGADRFKFINRVARTALEQAGLVSSSASTAR